MKVENLTNILKKYDDFKNVTINNFSTIGGMTNSNFFIETSKGNFILKLFGEGTESLINRKLEKKNLSVVQELGLDVKNYIFDENGVKVNEFIPNATTFDEHILKQNKKEVARILQTIHSSKKQFFTEFDFYKELEKYENLIKGEIYYSYYSEIKDKILKLKVDLVNLGLDYKSCHIDLVPENFIKDESNKIYLIDWEYCAMCDPMWDIAGLFLESNFTSNEEEEFLLYYSSSDTKVNIQKILIYKILHDFLWSLWTIYKEEQGSDFGDYGSKRYSRCLRNLREYINKYE